jgi:hypothetical protein
MGRAAAHKAGGAEGTESAVTTSAATTAATPRKRQRAAPPPAPPGAELLAKADRIRRQLAALYPSPGIPLEHTNHFQLLVAVMLSAQVARPDTASSHAARPPSRRRAGGRARSSRVLHEQHWRGAAVTGGSRSWPPLPGCFVQTHAAAGWVHTPSPAATRAQTRRPTRARTCTPQPPEHPAPKTLPDHRQESQRGHPLAL